MGACQSKSNEEKIYIPRGANYIKGPPCHSAGYSSAYVDDSGWFPPSAWAPPQGKNSKSHVSMSINKYVSQYETRDSNLVFPPLSIQLALGLPAAGSVGQTP